MKTEVIDFQKFMKNDWRKPVTRPVYSFIPIPTFASLFLTPGSMLILGLGLTLYSIALYERKLVSEGKESEAERIADIVGIVLPSGAIIGTVWVIAHAGRIFL